MKGKSISRLSFLKKSLAVSAVAALPNVFSSCVNSKSTSKTGAKSKLKFAYLTDVHLNFKNNGNGDEGLRRALAHAKENGAEFVLFGGDNVDSDALGKQEDVSDALHAHFKSIVDESGIEAHFTIGNHDRQYQFGGEQDKFGFKMFEKHMKTPSYSHFENKGVHFITLNAMHPDEKGGYSINEEQKEWLKGELTKIGKTAPIVVSTHVPFLSLYYPVVEGNFKGYDMINNTKEVFEILNDYNLKLVLQGHQHIYEQIQERNRWFVTAGAVSAYWWGGAFQETEEGYLMVEIDDKDNFSWEYKDYGWIVEKKND